MALAGTLFTLAVVSLIAFVGYLLIDGGTDPPACASGPTGSLDRITRSIAFDAKMAAFVFADGRPPVSTISVDEPEAGARAARYFDDHTDRISDVQVCFREGSAEGFMKVDTIFGRDVGVRAKGAVDLTGDHPRVDLSSARFAALPVPGFATNWVEDLINDQLDDVIVAFPMQITFSEDEATVGAAP